MCEFKKMIDTSLAGHSDHTAVALRLLAQMVDSRITRVEKNINDRHDELLKEIRQTDTDVHALRSSTDNRFKTLSVILFFAEHKKFFWFLVSTTLFLAGSGAENIISILFK